MVQIYEKKLWGYALCVWVLVSGIQLTGRIGFCALYQKLLIRTTEPHLHNFMVLTVIIVNYNVKYFLEQCLCSVKKALDNTPLLNGQAAEVMVVDNASSDGSVEYLRPRFSWVQFISNKENTGYARANNQALKLARGKYILFLNPDTILPEDIFQKAITFLQENDNAGALGVRMVDGSGSYLKESKRGLPGPWASLCKMTGLARLFPSSRTFAGYYMGHLDPYKTQSVQVLSGAFLLSYKAVLDMLNGFDEQFFMYAEDIDLSYRILMSGYRNYYLADTAIIHFKGESTRKDARYVRLFYKAMRQFVQKHYRSGSGKVFAGLLNAGISLRSGFAMLGSSSAKEEEKINAVWFRGDEGVIRDLMGKLPERGVQVQKGSNALVFCEGPAYPFQQLIKSLQVLEPGQQALIHASGSGGIVGSFDKQGQGVSIGL